MALVLMRQSDMPGSDWPARCFIRSRCRWYMKPYDVRTGSAMASTSALFHCHCLVLVLDLGDVVFRR